MTISPHRLIGAEETGQTPDGGHPCFSHALLTDPVFLTRLVQEGPSLAHAVDIVLSSAADELRAKVASEMATFRVKLENSRKNRAEFEKDFPKTLIHSDKAMKGIYFTLMRSIVSQKFVLNDNHARDFFHAVTSARCAHLVTLDRHWAQQIRQLPLPPTFGKVFTESQLPDFLAALESFPATRS